MIQGDKTRTTPFNPVSDGLVERFNRTLEDMKSKDLQPGPKKLG